MYGYTKNGVTHYYDNIAKGSATFNLEFFLNEDTTPIGIIQLGTISSTTYANFPVNRMYVNRNLSYTKIMSMCNFFVTKGDELHYKISINGKFYTTMKDSYENTTGETYRVGDDFNLWLSSLYVY